MSLRKILKLSLAGGVAAGSFEYLKRNDFDVSSLGVVRVSRALYTTAAVVVDYKLTYSRMKHMDPESSEYQTMNSNVHSRSARRIKELCCVNGACYTKVGQHLAALEYLLPQEYVRTLQVLHDDAPQTPLPQMMAVLEKELGCELSQVFSSFSERPIGTASLAQVYKASLLEDGSLVAVKIQHPRVKGHAQVDMKTMEVLVRAAAYVFPDFKLLWLVEETKKNLPLELDFVHEGKNAERASKLMGHFKFLKIPKIYWNLSTDRVLTMEYCQGGRVNDKEYMNANKIDVNKVSRYLGKLYSEMIFVHGYIHCDPHPGNVLVYQPNKGGDRSSGGDLQIVLLDHGLYQTLTDDFRVNYAQLWLGLIRADQAAIKTYGQRLGAGDLFPLFACILTARSWQAVTGGIGRLQQTNQEVAVVRSGAAAYLPQISQLLNRVPRQLLLILKCNDLLRGIEWSLGTRADATSFIAMSRCCVRALARHQRAHCRGWYGRCKVRAGEAWSLLAIAAYQAYLWLLSSAPLVPWLLGRGTPQQQHSLVVSEL